MKVSKAIRNASIIGTSVITSTSLIASGVMIDDSTNKVENVNSSQGLSSTIEKDKPVLNKDIDAIIDPEDGGGGGSGGSTTDEQAPTLTNTVPATYSYSLNFDGGSQGWYPWTDGDYWKTDYLSYRSFVQLNLSDITKLNNDNFVKLTGSAGVSIGDLVKAGVFSYKFYVYIAPKTTSYNDTSYKKTDCDYKIYYTTTLTSPSDTVITGYKRLADYDQGAAGFYWSHFYASVKTQDMSGVVVKYNSTSGVWSLSGMPSITWGLKVVDDGAGTKEQTMTTTPPTSYTKSVEYSVVSTNKVFNNVGKTAGIPSTSIQNATSKGNKWPDVNFTNASTGEDMVAPYESGATKVITCYYSQPSVAYFNYLADEQTYEQGAEYKFWGKTFQITDSSKPYSLNYFYDTIEMNFGRLKFDITFDVLKDLPSGNQSFSSLLSGKYIENLKVYFDPTIQFQVWSDTTARYSVSSSSNSWSTYEKARNDATLQNLDHAVTYNGAYSLRQTSAEYNAIAFSDDAGSLKVSLKSNFIDSIQLNNTDSTLTTSFTGTTNNIKNYVSYDFKYYDSASKEQHDTATPAWVESENATLSSDSSSVEPSHKVLDHTRLIVRDNDYSPIEANTTYEEQDPIPVWNDGRDANDPNTWPVVDGTMEVDGELYETHTPIPPEEWGEPDSWEYPDPIEHSTYKAKMKLKINDYYLEQILAGYDIATVQSGITINDYRRLVADWTLKFDKYIIDKDNELWDFLAKALREGKLIDINKSNVIDYQLPNKSDTYFKYEDMLKYDITYFLQNSQAETFTDLKNEVNNLGCPFQNYIKWSLENNLLDELESLFAQTNSLTIKYSYSTNYNSMILGEEASLNVSWADFIENGALLETPCDITESNPATLRVNNIVFNDRWDSYDASAKVMGMVASDVATKNSLGVNYVIYQNNGKWYDPDDPTDPNHPDYVDPNPPVDPEDPNDPSNPDNPNDPDSPVNPDDPNNPDNPGDVDPNAPVDPSGSDGGSGESEAETNSTTPPRDLKGMYIGLGIGGLALSVTGAATAYTLKRRHAVANLKKGKVK